MPHYSIGKTIIIDQDEFAYISHPSITVLQNGDWLAAYNHSRRCDPIAHPPDDPMFRTLLSRSADQGATWQRPLFAPNFDWYGTECPGIAQLSNGTVALSQYRFAWYPLPLARKLKADGERIAISVPERGFTEVFDEAEWEKSDYTWARGIHGTYIHLSHDGGHLFDKTIDIDCTPYSDGYARTGVIELADGRLAYALTEKPRPYNRHTYILFSHDKGESWSAPTVITDDPALRFGEPNLAEVARGEIYCILRASLIGEHLFGCRSTDDGQTWSEPEQTELRGYPGQLLVLKDGRLACTYGCRWEPFGIRISLSEDGGQTWDVANEIIIRDDLPNRDLGYPTTIEYAQGSLFCCYYGQEPGGLTCVQGTYVKLI
jgi:Neuraminidase (sialidase)